MKTGKDFWLCQPCNRRMHENQRMSHLTGKAHLKKLASHAQSLPSSVAGTSQHTNGPPDERPGPLSRTMGPRFWTCPGCLNIMARSRIEQHRCPDPAAEASDPAVDSTWLCHVCGVETGLQNRESHLAGKKHAINSSNPIEPHPDGKNFIPIEDVALVYGHVCEIPYSCYKCIHAFHGRWRGRRTMVTAQDVQRASDQFDGEGILEDIDTQWGLLPHGGAYKESEQYY